MIISIGKDEKSITPLHVERNIGISKDYNNYELQAALGKKDVLKANRIINYFAGAAFALPIDISLIFKTV